MKTLLSQTRATVVSLLVFTALLGVAYPLLVTGINQSTFPDAAQGSLIHAGAKIRGSSLIGQNFTKPEYLWGRLSATGPSPYNAGASSGSNLGVNNPALIEAVKARIDALGERRPVPVDLVTASASGLDPDISPAAADYQVARIAAVRAIPAKDVREAIAKSTSLRTFGILGEPRVNVLEVNLRLDGQVK